MQAQDFAETVRRPTKWFDQFCAQAAADVVQTDLIVFKYTSGQWHFMHRYYAKKRVANTPLPLFLKKHHFTTLDSQANIPDHWLTLTNDDAIIDVSFLGGGPKSLPQNKGAFSPHVEHAEENSPVSSSWLDPVADISSGADSPSPRSDIPSLEEDDCDSWLQPAPSTSQAPDSIIPQNTASDEIVDLDELISDAQPAASFLSFSGRWVKVGQARSKPQDDSGDKPEDTRDPKPPKQRIQEWVCPVCRLVIKGQHIPSLKAQHLRTRHPEFDKKLVQVPKKSEVVAMSHAIPEEQRDFTCPLCKKGLCALPTRERQRAIAEHCKEHHPDCQTAHQSESKR